MMIRSLALLALMSTTAFADENFFARVRNYGQEFTGFEYRVNTTTGEGQALLKFRELVDYPGPCPNPASGYCPPTWRYRYSSARVGVPNLMFDRAANRIVYTDPATSVPTVCANTESRRNTLYIYPTNECRVLAAKNRRWFEFFFSGR